MSAGRLGVVSIVLGWALLADLQLALGLRGNADEALQLLSKLATGIQVPGEA